MAVSEQLARAFDFYIKDADGTYIQIGGITSFSPSPEKNDTDVTDFDSAGWLEHIVASRSLSFTLEGNHLEDSSDGSRDSGQERLETLATNMGNDSIEMFKVEAPNGAGAEFNVSVDAPFMGMSSGGGNDDAAGWTCNLNMSGEPSVVAA